MNAPRLRFCGGDKAENLLNLELFRDSRRPHAVRVMSLGRGHVLEPNFLHMLCWLRLSAVLWIAGGLNDGDVRLGGRSI